MKADLVLVEWHDAHSDSAWGDPKDAISEHKPAVAFSCGWLLKRDKVGVSLFSSIVDAALIGERIFIPDKMVQKITVLKKAQKKG